MSRAEIAAKVAPGEADDGAILAVQPPGVFIPGPDFQAWILHGIEPDLSKLRPGKRADVKRLLGMMGWCGHPDRTRAEIEQMLIDSGRHSPGTRLASLFDVRLPVTDAVLLANVVPNMVGSPLTTEQLAYAILAWQDGLDPPIDLIRQAQNLTPVPTLGAGVTLTVSMLKKLEDLTNRALTADAEAILTRDRARYEKCVANGVDTSWGHEDRKRYAILDVDADYDWLEDIGRPVWDESRRVLSPQATHKHPYVVHYDTLVTADRVEKIRDPEQSVLPPRKTPFADSVLMDAVERVA